MIQTWSCSSTQTPMVQPSSQWFGSGFGHSGSTSNIGAVTLVPCASALLLQHRLADAEADDARGERHAEDKFTLLHEFDHGRLPDCSVHGWIARRQRLAKSRGRFLLIGQL